MNTVMTHTFSKIALVAKYKADPTHLTPVASNFKTSSRCSLLALKSNNKLELTRTLQTDLRDLSVFKGNDICCFNNNGVASCPIALF